MIMHKEDKYDFTAIGQAIKVVVLCQEKVQVKEGSFLHTSLP